MQMSIFFTTSVPTCCSSPLLSLSLPLFLAHSLYHYITITSIFCLPQLVARRCRQRMWPSWREVQPRSPAVCRTTMDQSWLSRIPADRPSSSTAREVCAHLSPQTNLICPCLRICPQFHFEGSLWNTLAMTHELLHFTFFSHCKCPRFGFEAIPH